MTAQGMTDAYARHLVGGGLILAGLALFASAWRVLDAAQLRGLLAVQGPYSYVRHPQYVALVAIMLGFLFAWPTLAALLLFTLLAWSCVRRAGQEDRRMRKQFGCCWRAYAYGRPAFVPRLSRVHLALVDLWRFANGRNGPRVSTAGAGASPTHRRTRS